MADKPPLGARLPPATFDGWDPVQLLTAMLHENVRRAGAWLYVQEQARDGMVSFVGASRPPPGWPAGEAHPFQYGSTRTHQLFVGELILRPDLVVATDTLQGMGLAGLAMHDHDVTEMIGTGCGEILLGRWT